MGIGDTFLPKFDSEILSTVKKHKKDYMRVFSGYEGEGKSLLASSEALRFDPDFEVKNQAIYSLEQFLDFQDQFATTPGKVCFMDEAVLQLLGDDSNTKESKTFKKIFITHRNKGHIYFLCTPSPFLMMPYIRKWRVRDCILVYTDPYSGGMGREIAYYSKKDYAKFITKKKAQDEIIIPFEFVKTYKPTLNPVRFDMITDPKVLKLYDEMDIKKTETQIALRKEARGMIEDGKCEEEVNSHTTYIDKELRQDAVIVLRDAGWKSPQIASIFGLSSSRIRQIFIARNNEDVS